MNRAFFLSVIAFLIILIGLTLGNERILLLAIPLLVFVWTAVWHTPRDYKLTVLRNLSAERVMSGSEVRVTLTVRNDGEDIEELFLEDVLPDRLEVVDGSQRHLTRLPSGESASWTYSIRGKRGYYMLHDVRVTIREMLGLRVSSQVIPTDGQLFIVPPVLRLRRVSIRPRRTRIFSGTIPARQGGPGVEFFDVREFQTGDSPRNINWRLTARHPQNIYANQYEQERVVDVGIILDGRRSVTFFDNQSIFEHSVMAAAALVDAFISAGNQVGMLFYGKMIHWTMPGYGKVQVERILHDLSRLEPGESQAFSELYIPSRLFPAKSQLVLISPLKKDDYRALLDLRSKGYAVMVISPDPVAFEASNLEKSEYTEIAQRIASLKRRLFLGRLRAIGIQVVNWDVSQPFEQVARQELERRPAIQRGGMG